MLHHSVHDLADTQEFAPQRAAVNLDGHALGKVALGDRADHARYLGGRLHHVLDEFIDRPDRSFPAAGRRFHAAALGDLALLADDHRQALEFARQLLIEADDLVEQRSNFRIGADFVLRKTHGEIATPQPPESRDEFTAVKLTARGLNIH